MERNNKVKRKFVITPEQDAWLTKKGAELDLSRSRLIREGLNMLIEAYGP